MNKISDFILRKKKNKQGQQIQKPLVQESMEGKTFHRCPNPKCDKLIENPATDITYVTEPPTVKLICPFCNTVLITTQKGELKVGKLEEIE